MPTIFIEKPNRYGYAAATTQTVTDAVASDMFERGEAVSADAVEIPATPALALAGQMASPGNAVTYTTRCRADIAQATRPQMRAFYVQWRLTDVAL